MDNNLINIIKKEKEKLYEDDDFDDDFSKQSFDLGIKVETDPEIEDWCIQKVLSDYQEARINVKLEKDDSQTCVVCHKYFPDSNSLYKHNLVHLIVPLIKHNFFMCDDCPKFYTKKKALKRHIIKHQSKKHHKVVIGVSNTQRTCNICKKTYSYKIWFDHMKTVHAVGEWQCKPCGLIFKCKRYLKRHVKYKHNKIRVMSEQKWDCPKCPSSCKNKYYLKEHIRNCHSNVTFKCKICKSKLKSKTYLRKHMMRVHYDDGTVHSCSFCGKIFKSPAYVRVHERYKHEKH